MYHSMIIPSFAEIVSKNTYPGSLSVLGEGPVKEIFNLEEGFLTKEFLTFFLADARSKYAKLHYCHYGL